MDLVHCFRNCISKQKVQQKIAMARIQNPKYLSAILAVEATGDSKVPESFKSDPSQAITR
jgi:hypothetical protein